MTPESENDLERAFHDAHLGTEQAVEYYRQLRESILIFLVPKEKASNGVRTIGPGKNMVFTTWTCESGVVLPIFTSLARMQEALQTTGKWRDQCGVGQMLGKELLHVLSMQPDTFQVAVNIGCSCGSRLMDMKAVKSIVDESALYIPTPGEVAMGGLCISLPERQPAKLREPLGKFFAGIPEVKAAWLFYEEEPKKPFEQVYVVGLAVVGGDAEEIRNEAALAIAAICPPEWNSRAILMDPQDPGFADIMRCQSFYRTADYVAPPKAA
jgi:hypothetical protein